MDVVSSVEDPSTSPWRRGVPASFLISYGYSPAFLYSFSLHQFINSFSVLIREIILSKKKQQSVRIFRNVNIFLITTKPLNKVVTCKCRGKYKVVHHVEVQRSEVDWPPTPLYVTRSRPGGELTGSPD